METGADRGPETLSDGAPALRAVGVRDSRMPSRVPKTGPAPEEDAFTDPMPPMRAP